MKDIVRVKFVKLEGEVIALFPDIPFDSKGNIMSYMKVGQHGAASPGLMKKKYCEEHEYRELERELKYIGYELDIMVKGEKVKA